MRPARRQSRVKEVSIKDTTKLVSESLYEPKTEDKPETEWRQTEDTTRDKAKTNRGQSRDNALKGKRPIGQTRDKVESKPRTQPETKWRQTEDKPETKTSFSSLVGLQARLAKIIFSQCNNNASLETNPLTLHILSELTGSPTSSIKKTLQRLEKKAIIKRGKFKNGRGGWTIYQINKSIYNELLNIELRDKVETNRGQTRDKVESKPETEPRTSLPSSNSSYKLNTNTTENNFDADWNLIQTPELLKELGFGKSHIDQIKNKFQYSPEEVTKFLESFAFDLKNGERERLKTKGINPIGYFFGAMKQGGYNPVTEGFKTSEELAQEEMIIRLEARKKEREEKKQKLEELLFDEWVSGKSKDELCEIEKPLNNFLDMFHKSALKSYFLEHEFDSFRPSYG